MYPGSSLRLPMTPCGDVIAGCVSSPLIGVQVDGRAVCLLTSSQLAEKEGPRALPLKNEAVSPSPGCRAAEGNQTSCESSFLSAHPCCQLGFQLPPGSEGNDSFWKVDKGAGSHPVTCLLWDLGEITSLCLSVGICKMRKSEYQVHKANQRIALGRVCNTS